MVVVAAARRVEPASRNNLKSEYQERVNTTSCTNRAHHPCFQGRAGEVWDAKGARGHDVYLKGKKSERNNGEQDLKYRRGSGGHGMTRPTS